MGFPSVPHTLSFSEPRRLCNTLQALVEFPKTTKSQEEWQAGLVAKLCKQIYADRIAAEKAQQKKMELR